MIPSLQIPRRGATQQTLHFRRWMSSPSKETPPNFPHYELRQTRFNDNDIFGHINNATYYNYMDDAVNMQLMDRGIGRKYPRFLAENGIQFYKPIAFPSTVRVGLRVVKLGSSSVTYDIGFFDNGSTNHDAAAEENNANRDDAATTLAARGKYVHVYIDEATGRPKPIPDKVRRVLELLIVEDQEEYAG